MKLFPIGLTSAGSSKGTMGDYTFDVFEPNAGVKSALVFSNLETKFENQTIQTRKKASPFITIEYKYENIWSREYRQLEKFVRYVEDSLTSFSVVDFSKWHRPTTITHGSGTWVVTNAYGRDEFSATTNYKADNVCVWDGRNWKIGPILTQSSHDITMSTVASHGGLLRATGLVNGALVYPVYTAHLTAGSMANFNVTGYNPVHDKASISGTFLQQGDGGPVYSGTLQFIGKYLTR